MTNELAELEAQIKLTERQHVAKQNAKLIRSQQIYAANQAREADTDNIPKITL